MTEANARRTANVLMTAAALGAAFVVLRSPSLRRLVWRIVKQSASGPLPGVAATMVRDAWDASGRNRLI